MSVVEQAPQQVFEELYDRYARDVYRYALAVLRNPADAEDVAQTTFMNAYRAIVRGERPEKPQHWLIVIAHNACRTRAIRASRRPREVPLDHVVRDVPVPESERPNLRAVLEALGELPFNQRSALVMRELEGRSYEEIAEMLGVTVSAVETLIFRARRSLRLRKDALRGLALVQLPASLQTFGGPLAGGSAVFGGGVVLKAAAVVAAVIAGGATIEAVQSQATHHTHRVGDAPLLFAASLGGKTAASRAATRFEHASVRREGARPAASRARHRGRYDVPSDAADPHGRGAAASGGLRVQPGGGSSSTGTRGTTGPSGSSTPPAQPAVPAAPTVAPQLPPVSTVPTPAPPVTSVPAPPVPPPTLPIGPPAPPQLPTVPVSTVPQLQPPGPLP
jgi:RNA polymerase sigma factor (sigma-70 family)